MRLAQVVAVIRYELVLQRRQRLLAGVILSTIALPLLMVVLFGQSNVEEIQRTWITSGGITTDAALQVTTRYAVTYSAMTLYMITLLILPVISADVIAKDQQHGVRELLDGLPLTPGTYLGGKVLGWWIGVAIGLLMALLVVGAGLRMLIGPYHIDQFALAWITIGWGIGLVNSTLSMLLAAGQPTRRRAIMVGVIFAAICLFANISLLAESGVLWNVLSPGRQAISMHFFLEAWRDQMLLPMATAQEVIWSLIGGVIEVAVVWTIAWAWVRRRA
jgi:ABC-type transport system involved in multi-copper enzyme maturation permease subunit